MRANNYQVLAQGHTVLGSLGMSLKPYNHLLDQIN